MNENCDMRRTTHILGVLWVLMVMFFRIEAQPVRDLSRIVTNNALVEKYDTLVDKYLYSEPMKALSYLEQGLREASKLPDGLVKAHFYDKLMNVYSLMGEPFNAINSGYKVLLIYDLYEYEDLYYEEILRLARAYFNANFCDEYFYGLLKQAYEYFDNKGDRIGKMKAKAYLNYLSFYINESERQVNELNFIDPMVMDTDDFVEINTVLAEYHRKKKNLRKSVAIYKKLEKYIQNKNSLSYYHNQLHLVRLYVDENNLTAASTKLKELVDYFRRTDNVIYLAHSYYLEVVLYFKKQDFEKAIEFAQQTLQLSRDNMLMLLAAKTFFELSELYVRTGQNDLALYSYSNFVSIRDSIYHLNKFYDISNNQLKLSSLKKEKENYLLRKAKEYEELKNRQQKLVILIFGLIAVILLFILSFLYYVYRANLRYSKRLKRFAQISQEGIIIYDENRIVEFNDKVLRLTGYTAEEFKNLRLEDLFDERIAQRIRQSQSVLFLEAEVKQKSGERFIAEVLTKSFPYTKFKNAKVISVHDVSEFRKAQRELIESQLKFKTLIDISPDSVIVTDLEGRITYISKAALELFGSDSVYLFMHRYLGELVSPQHLKEFENILGKLKDTDRPLQTDFIIEKEGKKVYVDCRCTCIKNSRGQVSGLFFILRDVTQRYLVQEALRRSEEKFRGLFNKAIDGIMILDEKGQIIDANPAAGKIFSIKQDELIHKNFIELLPPTIRKNFSIEEILKSDKTFETILVKQPDDLIYVQISVSLLSTKPQKQYLFILREITELRRNQERLKKYADKLSASNMAKAKLFSIISHDLRGPIGNLKSMIELILESPESFDTEELKEILVALKDTSVSTYELLENLLYWSKTQLDQIEYKPVEFPLHNVVASTISLFKEAARRKEIKIENFITREDIIVKADADMVKTILRNLLSNAIKFTPRGGRISLRYYADEEMVIVAVKDTGVGIPQERLMEIFDSTKFVSTRGTENEKGTGLGLDIVKEFVQKNRGKIWVESKPGKGSTFYFSLPKP